MAIKPELFRTDVRGIYPIEVNAETHQAIARAFATVIKPKTVAVGMDVRASGPELKAAVIEGLVKSGVDVIDIGIISTDMLYFAVGHFGYDSGLTVTASHNPAEYNGMKFALKNAVPLNFDNGMVEVRDAAVANQFRDAPTPGIMTKKDIMDDYLEFCLSFIDKSTLKPLRILINPNFGAVCYSYKKLLEKVNFEPILLNAEPDGTFPKGRPDPLREETRDETIALIKQSKPDFGVAWDADGDRVFFYDENGQFVDGYYTVSLLARHFLTKEPGCAIVYDARQWWATADLIKEMGGKPEIEKVGHVFLKGKMRATDAPFGGEMSGHYYFRDNFYCDNGLIPFLIMWQQISQGQSLAKLADPLRQKYPISGEINFTVSDQDGTLKKLEEHFAGETLSHLDGLSVDHDREWRANVRKSNNEPILRLNVEAKTQELVDAKVAEIKKIIT